MYIRDSWKQHRFFWGPVSLELAALTNSAGIELEVEPSGSDRNLMFSLRVVLLSIYLGFSSRWLGKLTDKLLRGSYEGRTIGLRVFDWAIWWDCWGPARSWSSSQPKWMSGCWHPLDTIFGQMKCTETPVGLKRKECIPMPEGAYPCTIAMTDARWKRPRLPWASHRIRRAHIECGQGIPFPGKGENSWDCGDDATYSMTCPAETAEEAIGRLVVSVLERRSRNGGKLTWDKAPAEQL